MGRFLLLLNSINDVEYEFSPKTAIQLAVEKAHEEMRTLNEAKAAKCKKI